MLEIIFADVERFNEQEYIYTFMFRLWLENSIYTFPNLELDRAWKPKFILKMYNLKIINIRMCAGIINVLYFCGFF